MKSRTWKPTVLALIVFAFGVTSVLAEVKTHGLFTDNMLLQRDKKVAVWGTTDK